MKLVILGLLLLGIVYCQVKPHENATGLNPPRFSLHLDLPPKQRWTQIAQAYKQPLVSFYNFFTSFTDQIPGQSLLFKFFGYWAKNMYKYQEMVEEVEGISEAVNLDFSRLMFLQFVYEYSVACSGIVVRNNQNQILHGRNMDFPGFQYISKLMAVVDFYIGKQKVCTVDVVVGSVSALTGIKDYKFAVNEDTRFIKRDGQSFTTVLYNIFVRQYEPSAWLLRRVLIYEQNFASAKKALCETTITAPIYYILSGIEPNEGTVIEKKIEGVHAVYDLNETTWFLVQTNYDRNDPDPEKDKRRTPAEIKIENIGPSITIQVLFDKIMSTYPSLNDETIFTMTAIAKTAYHNSTAWYGIVNGTDLS